MGVKPLTKAVMDLMLGMVGDNEALVEVIEMTRGKSEEEVGYVGGNAVTFSVKVDKAVLEGRDLSFVSIKGSVLNNVSLRGTNFKQANRDAQGCGFLAVFIPDFL